MRGIAAVLLLGTGSASAEIVVQVYAKVQYRPADQILSESGLGMTQWAQAFQRMPHQISTSTTASGPSSGFRCNRRLKIAYVSIALPEASHTAGKWPYTQTGAITSASQADAKRHEDWHIEIARGAAAKANELEAILIALSLSQWNRSACDSENTRVAATARIERLVLDRYNQLRQKYNAKLHEISHAGVVNGVWRDYQTEETPAAVTSLLAELHAEPPHEGLETLPGHL